MTSFLCEIVTVDRLLVLFEIVVIGVAAFLAYRVGRKQNQINENLLSLHLAPSLLVFCKLEDRKVHIVNKGSSTIYIWGLQENELEAQMVEPPRSVEPTVDFNHKIDGLIRAAEEKGKSSDLLLTVYLSSKDHKKYKLKTKLYFDFEENKLANIRSQSYPVEDWIE